MATTCNTRRRTSNVPAPSPTTSSQPVRFLAGGNPQIAKAQGDAPVQAYIAAMPGWKCEVGRRLDALVNLHVPHACKAVKWNSPFYGIEGQGWFLAFHVFTHYVKVTFFSGASLQPVPPGGTGKDAGSTSGTVSSTRSRWWLGSNKRRLARDGAKSR